MFQKYKNDDDDHDDHDDDVFFFKNKRYRYFTHHRADANNWK